MCAGEISISESLSSIARTSRLRQWAIKTFRESMVFSLPEVVKRKALLVSAFLVAIAVSSTMAEPIPVTKSYSQFAIQLYQECVAEKGGNVIISPFSIQTALSLAYMGATGETLNEMGNVMGYQNKDKKAVAEGVGGLLSAYKDSPLVKIANKVYVQDKYHIKAQFNEIATKNFNSETQALNFADNVNSAKTINTWVEEKTNDKIKDLIPSDALNDDTRMVLVNAIYFKGFWTNKFKVENTKPAPFWITPEKSINVDMMNTKADFKYGLLEDLDAVALEMPYKDSDLSMLIILPNKRDGLPALEAALSKKDLSEITSSMYKTEVIVQIPKFKIEYEIELGNVLQKLGMSKMFSNAAEFQDLLEENEPLKVSKVIHKAFIDVNEEGAEAAAATGVLKRMKRSMIVAEPKHFIIDHPFKWYMMSPVDHLVLFSGSLVDIPTSAQVFSHEEL